MLEKLATHDIQDMSALFSLADKCARVAEGRTWHSPAAQAAKGESTPSAGAQAPGGGNGNDNNNKKKKAGGNQPLAGAPTARATVADRAVAVREATNAPVSHPIVMTAARSARCTTPRAIPWRSARRSRSSWNNFVKRCSSSAKMARLPNSGRVSRWWTPRRRNTQRWSFRMQESTKGHLWPLRFLV
jgi:hypothetical protein